MAGGDNASSSTQPTGQGGRLTPRPGTGRTAHRRRPHRDHAIDATGRTAAAGSISRVRADPAAEGAGHPDGEGPRHGSTRSLAASTHPVCVPVAGEPLAAHLAVRQARLRLNNPTRVRAPYGNARGGRARPEASQVPGCSNLVDSPDRQHHSPHSIPELEPPRASRSGGVAPRARCPGGPALSLANSPNLANFR